MAISKLEKKKLTGSIDQLSLMQDAKLTAQYVHKLLTCIINLYAKTFDMNKTMYIIL